MYANSYNEYSPPYLTPHPPVPELSEIIKVI